MSRMIEKEYPLSDRQQFIDYFNAHDTLSARLGIRLLEVERDYACARMPVDEENRNLMGGLHGGALATLTDIAAGCSTFYYGRLCVTLNTSVQYLKGVRAGTVTAKARVLRAGGRVCTCFVEVFDDADALCCTATVAMYFTDNPIVYS
ncbi:PaaI family thioesterase [Christensenellaceae bacterium OttesenSCG-928-L17]|nr:PaaI family thioesterase [Christensenellaceae bacterium OttesenSCG-928-L17]